MREHADFVGCSNAVRKALQDLIELAFFRFELIDCLRKPFAKVIERACQNADFPNLIFVHAYFKVALGHRNCSFGHGMQRIRDTAYAPGCNQHCNGNHNGGDPEKGCVQFCGGSNDLLRGFDYENRPCKRSVRHENWRAYNKGIAPFSGQPNFIRADVFPGKRRKDLLGKRLLHFLWAHAKYGILILHALVRCINK